MPTREPVRAKCHEKRVNQALILQNPSTWANVGSCQCSGQNAAPPGASWNATVPSVLTTRTQGIAPQVEHASCEISKHLRLLVISAGVQRSTLSSCDRHVNRERKLQTEVAALFSSVEMHIRKTWLQRAV